MSKRMTVPNLTWTPRPDIPAPVRVESLRRGLLWTFGVVQAAFLAAVAYVYAVAEVEQNGDPWHDLGVALGREMVLSRIYEYWIITGISSAVAFAALYYVLRSKWTGR